MVVTTNTNIITNAINSNIVFEVSAGTGQALDSYSMTNNTTGGSDPIQAYCMVEYPTGAPLAGSGYGSSQDWSLVWVASNTYIISNQNSHESLDPSWIPSIASDPDQLMTSNSTGAAVFYWNITNIAAGRYQFFNPSSGRGLNNSNTSTEWQQITCVPYIAANNAFDWTLSGLSSLITTNSVIICNTNITTNITIASNKE